MNTEIISVDGGSKQYWLDLKAAHALIAWAEQCRRTVRNSPQHIGYYVGGDDEMEIEENFGPWDDLHEAIKAVKEHPMAMRVLYAQGRDIATL